MILIIAIVLILEILYAFVSLCDHAFCSFLVMQEFFVKKKDRVEVVAMLGVFGVLISICEMYPFHCEKYLYNKGRTKIIFLKEVKVKT